MVIDEFIKKHGLSDGGFCQMLGRSKTWLSKLRRKVTSADQELPMKPAIKRIIERLMTDNQNKIPESALRKSAPKTVPNICCDPNYDITHIINLIAKSGKSITWQSFSELCSADCSLTRTKEKLGL